MRLIDTHGHLNFGAFAESWPAAADRAREHGVQAVVIPGSQAATSVQAIALAKERPSFLYAAVGLHPTHIRQPAERMRLEISDQRSGRDGKYEEFDYDTYIKLALEPEVVAIGEVGLDTYRMTNNEVRLPAGEAGSTNKNEQSLQEQELVLQSFIQIAQEVEKPLILHCRGSKKPELRSTNQELQDSRLDPHERLIELLAAVPADQRPKFVVHCYQGTVEQAKRYLDLGGMISFTGTITYSNDPAVTEVARAVPLERLMIETDSPYLSPVPYRGEENEPWKVVEVARRVAQLQELSLEEVGRQTTANACNFFDLK